MAAPPPTKSPLDRLTHALTSIGQPRVTAPPNPLDHTPTQLNTIAASSPRPIWTSALLILELRSPSSPRFALRF
eukprot:scaffold41706_cov63-Phaeocystis_antarctica.AAC.1